VKLLEHISLKELNKLPIKSETMLTVTIEDKQKSKSLALRAMKKLRGSGNGKLTQRLLKERKAERKDG
jgi:hypothetical protein